MEELPLNYASGPREPAVEDEKAGATKSDCDRAWRWGMWSPSDQKWYDEVGKLWQVSSLESERPTPSVPLKIHQIWLGPRPLPRSCVNMMESWKANHPTWEYKLWTDLDAETALVTPNLREAFSKARNPAEKSDIVRLGLILEHGGLYVDVDFECLQPFDGFHRRFSFFSGLSNVGVFELNNGLFAASPGHPLVSFLCERVGRPWPEWGQSDVDPREAVAHQLELSGMLGGGLLAPSGQAPFLATTGPRGRASSPAASCGSCARVSLCRRAWRRWRSARRRSFTPFRTRSVHSPWQSAEHMHRQPPWPCTIGAARGKATR